MNLSINRNYNNSRIISKWKEIYTFLSSSKYLVNSEIWKRKRRTNYSFRSLIILLIVRPCLLSIIQYRFEKRSDGSLVYC